jgi:hypothetical protein
MALMALDESRRMKAVEQGLAAAVERAELNHSPFDHIYMDELFDPETYRALLAAVPDVRHFREVAHRDAIRPDGSSTRLRLYLYPELLWRLPAGQRRVWMPVVRALCSRRLRDAFGQKFKTTLERRFGKPVDRIALYPVPILLRDQPGYQISIHSDAGAKAITVQFYLPADGSQRHVGTIFHEGGEGEQAERTTQMPFLPASGYAFPVAISKSWHSAARTSAGDGERVSILLTYYSADTVRGWFECIVRRAGLFFGMHPRR